MKKISIFLIKLKKIWLRHYENNLELLNDKYKFIGKTAMKKDYIHGRPHGGIGWIVPK